MWSFDYGTKVTQESHRGYVWVICLLYCGYQEKDNASKEKEQKRILLQVLDGCSTDKAFSETFIAIWK